MGAAEGAVAVDGADDDCANTGKFRRPANPQRKIAASEYAITRMKILEHTTAVIGLSDSDDSIRPLSESRRSDRKLQGPLALDTWFNPRS